MFGLGNKCSVCGIKVKDNAVREHGKKFCSQTCSDEYGKKLKKEKKKQKKSGGGCCG